MRDKFEEFSNEINDQKLDGMSVKSLLDFTTSLNEALSVLMEANPEVPGHVLIAKIFQICLAIPYQWFKNAGNVKDFYPAMVAELKLFMKIFQVPKRGLFERFFSKRG